MMFQKIPEHEKALELVAEARAGGRWVPYTPEEIQAKFQEALRLDPNCPELHIALGKRAHDKRDYEAARAHFSQAMTRLNSREKYGPISEIPGLQARTYFHEENWESALHHYAAHFSLTPRVRGGLNFYESEYEQCLDRLGLPSKL